MFEVAIYSIVVVAIAYSAFFGAWVAVPTYCTANSSRHLQAAIFKPAIFKPKPRIHPGYRSLSEIAAADDRARFMRERKLALLPDAPLPEVPALSGTRISRRCLASPGEPGGLRRPSFEARCSPAIRGCMAAPKMRAALAPSQTCLRSAAPAMQRPPLQAL